MKNLTSQKKLGRRNSKKI